MAGDNVVAGLAGGLRGVNDILGKLIDNQLTRKRAQEDLLRREESQQRLSRVQVPDALAEQLGMNPGEVDREVLNAEVNLSGQRNRATIARERAKGVGGSYRPNSFTQNVPAAIVEDFYVNFMGQEPPKESLSLAQFNSLLRMHGINSQNYFKDLGTDIQLGKNALGEVTEEARDAIQKKRQKRFGFPTLHPPGNVGAATSPTLQSGARGTASHLSPPIAFQSPEQVGQAFRNKVIDESTARKILLDQFGVK